MSKKKLILSGLVITNALLVASISMTIAWYGYSSSLTVDSLNVSFIGEKDLLIGYSPDDFHESLGNPDQDPVKSFAPVSSMYSQDWIKRGDELPKFKTGFSRPSINRPTSFTKPGDASSGYFQTAIYLKSSYTLAAVIDDSGPLILPDEKANLETAKRLTSLPIDDPKTIEVKEKLDKINLSMRVSLYFGEGYYLIMPAVKEDHNEAMFCGPMSLFNNPYYDYYKKDGEKYEYVYGSYENGDKIVYNEPKLEDSKPKEQSDLNWWNAKTRGGVHGFNFEASISKGFKPEWESLTAADSFYIPLNANEPVKVIVSVYIEGWDKDNINDCQYASFISNIKFKIKEGI